MTIKYANEFSEIHETLINNQPLRDAMLLLIAAQPMAGKATVGGNRLAALRNILQELTSGILDIAQAIHRVETDLPPISSSYAGDRRVFADGWAERLIRTQFSRFYNQAVLEQLLTNGVGECHVPHSKSEAHDSLCSIALAGQNHRVDYLLALLTESYGDGQFSKTPKIPNHPHCTHVVRPLD